MQGSTDLAPGTRFGGEYTILRPLAEGGMGHVYAARQESTGRERALKVLHPWLVEDPESRVRFAREARVSGLIASDHVVDVIAAGVDEATGLPFIAMELLSGRTLAEHLDARGALSKEEARDFLAQIAHALGAAHRQGLVHRDLKPENVMVVDAHREGGRPLVKLLDFGIAKLVALQRTNIAATSAIGSPRWMAPEQTHESLDITPRTDVFAFGLLAFWLFTGRLYWLQPDAGVPVILRQLHVDALEPASTRAAQLGVAGRLPPGFDAWFAHTVARSPAERWPDAARAMEELDRVLARADIALAGTVMGPSPVAPTRGPHVAAPLPPISPASAPTAPLPRASPMGGIVVQLPPMSPRPAPPAWRPPIAASVEPPRSRGLLWAVIVVLVGFAGGSVGVLAWLLAPQSNDPADPPPAPRVVEPLPVPIPAVAPLVPVEPTPFVVGQTWRGDYDCIELRTPATLEIRAVANRRVDAIFRFRHATGGDGAFYMSGDYEPDRRRLALTPGAWIQQPQDFVSVGLDGFVSPDGRVYSGGMTNPACSRFRFDL